MNGAPAKAVLFPTLHLLDGLASSQCLGLSFHGFIGLSADIEVCSGNDLAAVGLFEGVSCYATRVAAAKSLSSDPTFAACIS